MAEITQGNGSPIDFTDPAQVMAALRGASRELRRGDARIAQAEERALEAEGRLARAVQDQGGPELRVFKEQAIDAELRARTAEDSLRAVRERAESAERALAASRQKFRLTLAPVAGLALLGTLSSGYLALQRPAPPPPAQMTVEPAKQASVEPSPQPKVEPSTPGPNAAQPSSVLDRLGPPRSVKTILVSSGYDSPTAGEPIAAEKEAKLAMRKTALAEEPSPDQITSAPNTGQLRAPIAKPKRGAVAPP